MLGYAATTDVRDVPVVVADADRSAASRELIARFDASPNFTIAGVVPAARATSIRISSAAMRGWRWSIPAGYGDAIDRGRPAIGAGDCRRQRRELDERGAGLRDEPDRAATRRS